MANFLQIPENEKKSKWYRLLYPLYQARLFRNNPEKSNFLVILNDDRGWKNLKARIENALKTCIDSERIFSRTSQIKKDPSPDDVIDDMFAELEAIPYLSMKGFHEIAYKKENVDFTATFNGKKYGIEVAFKRGPDFKTQKIFLQSSNAHDDPSYWLDPETLIKQLEKIYKKKKKQILKHGYDNSNAIILLISHSAETYEPWLNHDLIEGKHPIENFIEDFKEIPTVVFGCGSLYEPSKSPFDKLQDLNMEKYYKRPF